MQITLEIPDEIANSLGSQLDQVPRGWLELLAAESYRQGVLGAGQIRQMLGFRSRWETYDFLKREQAYMPYDMKDLEEDSETIAQFLDTWVVVQKR